MKQIISLSIVSIAFDTAEMRRMNRALTMFYILIGSNNKKRKIDIIQKIKVGTHDGTSPCD